MQYLRGDATELLKYARDINCHFASKKCKDVIVAARKLMTSEMHNTVKVCDVLLQSIHGLIYLCGFYLLGTQSIATQMTPNVQYVVSCECMH